MSNKAKSLKSYNWFKFVFSVYKYTGKKNIFAD